MNGFVIAVIIILIILLIAGGIGLWIYLSSAVSTLPPTTTPTTDQTKTGRTYTFTRGQDGTWTGKEDALKISPFISVDDSNKTCDATSGCVGWVRYSGNSYYRPTVATTPTAWDTTHTTPFPDDGTYLANK